MDKAVTTERDRANAEIKRLWELETAPKRGPKATHSARSIARAGIALADSEGFSAVSMRKVATRLSVSAMSLYNQVPGKAELLELMIDEVAGEMLEPTSGEWATRAETLLWRNWDWFLRHPWLVQTDSYRPVLGPHILQKYETELAVFEDIGLTDIEMDFALSSLLAMVKGCAMSAIDAEGLIKDGTTANAWWENRKPMLDALNIDSRFPLATRIGSAIGASADGPTAPKAVLQFGFACWRAGIADRIKR